jgi:group I intron endonuclease
MNKEVNYKVYEHINKINGKIYIGITKQNVKNRWQNGKGYKYGRFHNAVKKYGWDNFDHIILNEGLSEHVAKDIEKTLIHKYDSTNKTKGYNTTKGGDGTTGYKVNDNTKLKISNKLKGRKFSDETLLKMKSSASKRKHSVATIEKLKTIGKGELNNNSKSIICITTGEIFTCMRYARDKYGKSLHITECCNRTLKSAGKHPITNEKLKWMYLDEYIELTNNEFKSA